MELIHNKQQADAAYTSITTLSGVPLEGRHLDAHHGVIMHHAPRLSARGSQGHMQWQQVLLARVAVARRWCLLPVAQQAKPFLLAVLRVGDGVMQVRIKLLFTSRFPLTGTWWAGQKYTHSRWPVKQPIFLSRRTWLAWEAGFPPPRLKPCMLW